MARFAGKVAIVTGGANGIGAAVAARLAAEGAKVMIADIQEPASTCDSVAFIETDGTSARQVAALVDATVAKWGRIDILVNNAGLGALSETPEMEEELWDKVFAINTKAIYLFCKYAIPVMRAQGGAIINVASISGLGGDYGMGVYNASKGAVINYTRSLALDCARDGIRVNALCPGLIETAMTALTVARPADREAWLGPIPLARMGKPEEMASVIAFLASDDASYMTGSILTADGGITCHTGQPNVPARRKLREQQG
ncbi:SDR family oxidoreductase [Novosphingobium sp. MMS21-SN21R]|uniref:SDR family NAD(P)-dependent oxidoreductase n=1 Tax=Novosphingobium sp. MMS21-SN21R TaxID=2969298 RepID=UPI0028875B37|nr:SDR family oxidoreductase [Novosphingobium sp. MMS21-SN21R]MDT0509814.1 SDR family oxidoreductase [Novosphingobium sp. MMS21-SN21R]